MFRCWLQRAGKTGRGIDAIWAARQTDGSNTKGTHAPEEGLKQTEERPETCHLISKQKKIEKAKNFIELPTT
jgi:hypothetical protein